jgi:16S rRNA pseudouridine516 synthase
MNVRLDKYCAELGLVPRRAMSKAIKAWLFFVDWKLADKSDQKISFGQIITYLWEDIEVKESIYVILNKPAGYVCSDVDEWWHASYQMLLQDCPYGKMLHVAGRLDFDTEWLVLCSNDGKFTHDIISPKKHLEKEYYVATRDVFTDNDIRRLESWVQLDDWYVTLPAKVTRIDDAAMKLIIVEGKFHQVKRMLEAIWNQVTYLRRDRIGDWTLDGVNLWKRKYIGVL